MINARSILMVDWENFRRKIKSIFEENNKISPMWRHYDFRSLFDRALANIRRERELFYFSRIKEDPRTREKSKQLIELQRFLKNHLEKQEFEIVFGGYVRGQMQRGTKESNLLVFKEKGVDVKIAVDMVRWACDKKVDEIILASSDSDLQPAISEVRARGVRCVYLGFESQPNRGMMYTTHRTILIKDSDVFTYGEIS